MYKGNGLKKNLNVFTFVFFVFLFFNWFCFCFVQIALLSFFVCHNDRFIIFESTKDEFVASSRSIVIDQRGYFLWPTLHTDRKVHTKPEGRPCNKTCILPEFQPFLVFGGEGFSQVQIYPIARYSVCAAMQCKQQ